MNEEKKIIRYNPYTGEPVYAKVVGYNTQTGEPIYDNMTEVNQVNVNSQLNRDVYIEQEGVKYAGIGDRIGAFVLDSIIYGLGLVIIVCLVWPIIIMIVSLCFGDTITHSPFFKTIGSIVVLIPMLLTYFGQPVFCLFGDASKKHASIGKRIVKCQVVDADGNPLTFGKSFIRMLAKFLNYIIPCGLIVSLVMIGASSKGQSLHDMILNQYVVKIKK